MTIDVYDHRLNMADSQTRAAALVEICQGETVENARALLAHWFNICDAVRPWLPALREQFERCAPVTDDPVRMRKELKLPCVVYRGAWHDDDTAAALSWTLDREDAEKFCRIISGPRGWFLGMKRDDARATVFRGVCVEAYGYLTGRDESEVIAARVEEIEPISALMSAEQAAEYQRTGILP